MYISHVIFNMSLLRKFSIIIWVMCMCESKRQDWQLILQTDIDGDEVSGSKAALIAEVLQGSELRIIIDGWHGKCYIPNVDNIQIVQDNVCVQSLMNIGRNRLGHYEEQTYWSYRIFCSTGHAHTIRFVATSVGRPAVPETYSRAKITWYVRKLICEEETVHPVYCNNVGGNETCGSRYNLARDVNNGADLRLVDTQRKYVTSVSNAQTTSVGNIVSAQCQMHMSQHKVEDNMVFKKKAYWWYSLWSSSATIDMWFTGVARKALLGHFTQKRSIDWFSDTCWKMVYSHDDRGRKISGSLSTLVEAIQAGHRVKVKIRNYTAEADNILIKNGHVSAQLLWLLSQFTIEYFKPNPWWVWEHISTWGFKESKIYRIGIVRSTRVSIYPVSVIWFIDSRKWRKVYSNDKTGKATKGSKNELVNELQSGRKLRYLLKLSYSESILLEADNIVVSRDFNVSSQSLRIMNFEAWGAYSRRFHRIPAWMLTEVNANGTVESRYSNVGNTTIHRRDSFDTDIDWFVN